MELLKNRDMSKFFILTIFGLIIIYLILDAIVSVILFDFLKLGGHPYELDGHPVISIISLLNSVFATVLSIFMGWKFSKRKLQVRRGTWAE
tara:strand:- start:321 stop:593 length:273 start_codon:yes stop_codon:yes gene_type:complete